MYQDRTVVAEHKTVAESYLRFCAENLPQLEQYIDRRDEQALLRIAATLSGNANRVGLSDLSGIGTELHRQIETGNWLAVAKTYYDLVETVSRLCDTEARPVAVDVADPAPSISVPIRLS